MSIRRMCATMPKGSGNRLPQIGVAGSPLLKHLEIMGRTSFRMSNVQGFVCFYYHFISFYFITFYCCFCLGIAASCSVSLQQRDVPLIKNAQALDLRKFSKPTGHNAHHSTEQEDGGRAQLYVDKWTRDSNLTTHVVIDWVSGTFV